VLLDETMRRVMGKYVIASVLVVALAPSAVAAGAKYYLEIDTVGTARSSIPSRAPAPG
jgi:hypothetical protein